MFYILCFFGDQIILYNLDLGHSVLHKNEKKTPLKTKLMKYSLRLVTKNTITDYKKVDISSKKYNFILIGFMKLGQITIFRFDLLR